MKYTVLWSRASQDELTLLWNAARDRAALSAAANLIDAALAKDPLECGESREHDEFRIMFAYPLAVEFFVKAPDQTVIVVGVWRTK